MISSAYLIIHSWQDDFYRPCFTYNNLGLFYLAFSKPFQSFYRSNATIVNFIWSSIWTWPLKCEDKAPTNSRDYIPGGDSTAPIFVHAKVSFVAWFRGGVGFGGAWTWTKPLQAELEKKFRVTSGYKCYTVWDCILRDWKWKDVGRGSETFKSLVAIWIIYSEIITSPFIGRFLCWKVFPAFVKCSAVSIIYTLLFVFSTHLTRSSVFPSPSRTMSIFGGSNGTSVYGGSFNAITYATRPSGKLMTIDKVISWIWSWCTPKRYWQTHGSCLSQCLLWLR